MSNNSATQSVVILLHGNRQTGELLLSRVAKLRSKLKKIHNIQLITLDAPHFYDDDNNELYRTWWTGRHSGNSHEAGDYRCFGLTKSIEAVLNIDSSSQNTSSAVVGLFGFSQGARLIYYLSVLHLLSDDQRLFPNLNFVVLCAGYEDPLPVKDLMEFIDSKKEIYFTRLSLLEYEITLKKYQTGQIQIKIPSLHIIGETDKLIPSERSLKLMECFVEQVPSVTKHFRSLDKHQGGHHIPMRAANINTMLNFIQEFRSFDRALLERDIEVTSAKDNNNGFKELSFNEAFGIPDEDHQMEQTMEIEALQAIFPDEFRFLSNEGDFPIEFDISISCPPGMEEVSENWPPRKLSLRVKYPSCYPDDLLHKCKAISFSHKMNVFEFPSFIEEHCMNLVNDAIDDAGSGVPCVMNCVNVLHEYFESGMYRSMMEDPLQKSNNASDGKVLESADTASETQKGYLKDVSQEELSKADLEGETIALNLLNRLHARKENLSSYESEDMAHSLKGGVWKYTIGLVGKPSAGKSTFFNAASAFARQRDGQGGASMAPHPFTTIDPNVGYCFVPAPKGSCPEENTGFNAGSSHGRDSKGRRLLAVTLKDVAGLVPGAYQGRGKGNKFLDDLTDADALIHVVDASGTSDTEGNSLGPNEKGSNPLEDLAWIRNELIEWITFNLVAKWDTIARKGQKKLVEMFSGYKQAQGIVYDVISQVEKFMKDTLGRDKPLDHLGEWNKADLRRLISAFMGYRFPIALALNKIDLPTASKNVEAILEKIPVHGSYKGTALCAHSEMKLLRSIMSHEQKEHGSNSDLYGVRDTLQSVMEMRGPVLVFPVSDLSTYEPLPGMTKVLVHNASLPNENMNRLLFRSGKQPSLWNDDTCTYNTSQGAKDPLRDVILMKPGSTVGDVFSHLKNLGALAGDFVRAEAVGSIGNKSNMIPKSAIMGQDNRIIKIMTNKKV